MSPIFIFHWSRHRYNVIITFSSQHHSSLPHPSGLECGVYNLNPTINCRRFPLFTLLSLPAAPLPGHYNKTFIRVYNITISGPGLGRDW